MKNIKKLIKGLLLALLLLVVGCGGEKENASNKKVIKIGLNGDATDIWKYVADELAKEEIELKFVNFADYIRPNLSLQEKEIDANAFQTEIYFDTFKKEHKLTVENLGYTVLAPMGVYSKKIKDLSELKDGATVAIPNDSSNGGRGLLLLQDAGLIQLKDEVGAFPKPRDIISNPKNIKIVELTATQIPRSLDDIDAVALNNGVAVDAGYNPLNDSIFLEDKNNDRLKKYFNIIAVREDNKNNLEIKRLLEIYQSEENRQIISDYYKGSSIAAF